MPQCSCAVENVSSKDELLLFPDTARKFKNNNYID